VYLFEGLKDKVSSYLPSESVDDITRAFVLAERAHDGQKRSSGDPYITHPTAVAGILADMHMDKETIMAALLHDVIEDTYVSYHDLSESFGQTVADLVEGVSKLDKLAFNTSQEAQIENFRKMIMAMVEDIRVILIKLADRTHNMRTLDSLRTDKRHRIAMETLEIYAPLANRLGIHDIKNELEDLGFKAKYPMRYRALKSAVDKARGNRKEFLDNIDQEITTRLQFKELDVSVIGRQKHLYSIYRKMKNKELMFNEVMDIFAFRIIVNSLDDCYRVLGAMHSLYKPIEGRFKDYIAIPRTNGYQSLHTSLVGPHGIPLEIQIRTAAMDAMADKGVAAHWNYKDGDGEPTTTAQNRARKWMHSLMELQQNASSSFEFIENVKQDLFPAEIYVFTPDGQLVELPMGATAVDFAYAVHTDIGHSCVGVRVNNRNFSLNLPLDNSQTVEIITSPRAKPNASWLNFVVTSKARANIRQYLKNQRGEEALVAGTRLLRHALGSVKLDDIPQADLDRVTAETNHSDFESLLMDIGLGNALSAIVARQLLGESPELRSGNNTAAVVGTEGLVVNYGKCCSPIPSDDIIAVLNLDKGIMIHQTRCSNIRKLSKEEPHKILPMQWAKDIETEFSSNLRVELENHQGTLAALTQKVASCDSEIITLHTQEKESNIYYVDIEFTTRNRIHLAQITRKIRAMPQVRVVSRHSRR
jgi:RelA/SpoT family (p)ppGpp synthetase